MKKRRRFSNKIHAYKQTCELSNISIVAGITPTLAGYNFALSQLANASSFTQLYDQYRILGVKITFYPQYTNFNATTTASGAASCPEIYTAIDLDSANAPASISELDQYTTCRRQIFNRPHSRYFRPTALGALYVGAAATGYYTLGKKWIDMANSDAPYYGIKVGIVTSNSTLSVAQLIRVTATYYLQCRNVR